MLNILQYRGQPPPQSLNCVCVCLVILLCPLWTVACQAPLSIEFFRQKYWSGLSCPSPGDLLDPGIKPTSPALAGRCFTTEPPGKAQFLLQSSLFVPLPVSIPVLYCDCISVLDCRVIPQAPLKVFCNKLCILCITLHLKKKLEF